MSEKWQLGQPEERQRAQFKRPFLIVEQIFERVALACTKSTSGRISACTTCKSAGSLSS